MLRAVAAAGRLLRAAVALAVLAGFIVGVPWLLAAVIGWPLDWIGWPDPADVPGPHDLLTAISTAWSDENVLGVLATCGWVLWLAFCRDVIVEAVAASAAAAAARRGDARLPVRSRGPIGWTAAVLVGAIVGAVLLDTLRGAVGAPSRAATASAAASTEAVVADTARSMALPASKTTAQAGPRPALAVPAELLASTHLVGSQLGTDEMPAWARSAPGGVHRVVKGDNLWNIADAKLGDPYRWREIYVLNRGKPQPNGHALHDPDAIHIGWWLALPAREPPATTARSQPPTAVADMTPAAIQPPGPVSEVDIKYRVARGDRVWDIADRYLGDPQRYTDIAARNPEYTEKYANFPDHIEPGDRLKLPAEARDRGRRDHAEGIAVTVEPRQPTPGPRSPATPATPPPQSPTQKPTPPTALPDPDGVVEPDVAAPASSAPTSSPAAAPSTPAEGQPVAPPSVPSESPPAATPSPGIDLPGGGWVAGPFALAVASAAALAYIQRRRRYRPRPPAGARRTDPDLAPMPNTIAALQHEHPNVPDAEGVPNTADQTVIQAATVTTATLGTTGDGPLHLPDLPATGVGLDGPGVHDAARGILAAVLAAGGPWAPAEEARIITTRTDLAQLLPTDTEPRLGERLHITDDPDQAHTELERQLLRRARVAAEHHDEPDDVDQQAPIVLLTSTLTGPAANRLAAILTVGARLGIGAVLLGPWALGATWHVGADGIVSTDVEGQTGTGFNMLNPGAAMDILATLAEARPGSDDLPPAPPASPAPPVATATRAVQPVSALPGSRDLTTDVSTSDEAERSTVRLRLRILGPPELYLLDGDAATELKVRRTDSWQVLVYLAVEPDGATSDQLMEALYPEVRRTPARRRFYTSVSELRQLLNEAAGADVITRQEERYRLDPRHITVDVWQLHVAVDRAAVAVDPMEQAENLREVVARYTGPLADGHTWLWLTPYRDAVQRHVIDACSRLADLDEDPRNALTLIQNAITIDPYNEDLYQRAMRLHAVLNSAEGVHTTLRTLTKHLAELEVKVSPQTQQIAVDLLAKIEARNRFHGHAA